MKQLLIIGISLSLFAGGLMFNKNHGAASAGMRSYWLQKNKKEMFRDIGKINNLQQVINNSIHFIESGFSVKLLPF